MASKKQTPSTKLNESGKKARSVNTTSVTPVHGPGMLGPTINNFVNITTIGNAPIPNFVTIPAKLRQAYIISPVMQSTPTNDPKPFSANKKRFSVKTSEPKKKQKAVPAKSEKHSKQHSLDTSIGDLLKKSKPTSQDIGFTSIKVKDLV